MKKPAELIEAMEKLGKEIPPVNEATGFMGPFCGKCKDPCMLK